MIVFWTQHIYIWCIYVDTQSPYAISIRLPTRRIIRTIHIYQPSRHLTRHVPYTIYECADRLITPAKMKSHTVRCCELRRSICVDNILLPNMDTSRRSDNENCTSRVLILLWGGGQTERICSVYTLSRGRVSLFGVWCDCGCCWTAKKPRPCEQRLETRERWAIWTSSLTMMCSVSMADRQEPRDVYYGLFVCIILYPLFCTHTHTLLTIYIYIRLAEIHQRGEPLTELEFPSLYTASEHCVTYMYIHELLDKTTRITH